MTRIQKKYELDFKKTAVKLSYEKKSIKECAEELRITPRILNRWRQESREFETGGFPGSGYILIHPEKKKQYDLEKRVEESTLNLDILKKGHNYLFRGKQAIYQFIKSNEGIYSVRKMCLVLGVSRTTYSEWKKNGIPKKQQYLILLKKDIVSIFHSFKGRFGHIKITEELHLRGYNLCRATVGHYMKQLGLKPILKRKFKMTTDSNHNYYTAPNIVNRNFKVTAPSKVWVSDITYLQTLDGFLYLTIIIDLFDRKIIGWSIGSALSTISTTLPALEMAIKNRTFSEGLIFHSDRGVQYANKTFANALDSLKCVKSMSRKANCLDNAVSESFFSILKKEMIHGNCLLQKKQLKIDIFEYIEKWYNKTRLHSALNYQTIEEFGAIRQK
jgi:transposase InsO family protein/transposase-like protein